MYVEWLGSKHEAGTRFDQLDESSKNSGCVVSGEANVRRRAWHDDGDLTAPLAKERPSRPTIRGALAATLPARS